MLIRAEFDMLYTGMDYYSDNNGLMSWFFIDFLTTTIQYDLQTHNLPIFSSPGGGGGPIFHDINAQYI